MVKIIQSRPTLYNIFKVILKFYHYRFRFIISISFIYALFLYSSLGVNDDSRKFKETYATDEKKGDYISESIEDNNATYQSNQKITKVDEFIIRKKEKIFNSSVMMFPSEGNELKESQVEQIKIRKEKEMSQNLVLSNTNITYSQFRENKDNVNAAHSRYSRKHQNNTVLLSSDVIYGRDWWEKPVVIEEFKFVFFPFPKVSSFSAFTYIYIYLTAVEFVHLECHSKLNVLYILIPTLFNTRLDVLIGKDC